MKLVIPLLLLLVAVPAYGQLLSDQTGLVNRFDVETSGHTFEVRTVANFDVLEHEFDKDEKRLTFLIYSSLENNLGEVIIPASLLGGNFTFYLDEERYFPKANSNAEISFITLNFLGSGNHKLDILGTTYLDGLSEISKTDLSSTNSDLSLDYGLVYGAIVATVLIVGGIIFIIKQRNR